MVVRGFDLKMAEDIKPVGEKVHRVEFVMPYYAHTGYSGKHNHRGNVAHRFLVELSYARESDKDTQMDKLARMVNYAEVYPLENHTVIKEHSTTRTDLSKVVLYVSQKNMKNVMELVYELRDYLGVLTVGEREGVKGRVYFNTSEVVDYQAN